VGSYQVTKNLQLFPVFFFIILIHLFAILGIVLYHPNPTLIVICFIMYWVQLTGILMTYHRCLTHHAFDFKFKWLERIFVTFGALSLQRGPIFWSGVHRIHHQHADKVGDPHNRQESFWKAHVLWLGHVDPHFKWGYRLNEYKDYAPDIASDPYYRWLDRIYYLPTLILWLLFYLIGGWGWFFWGGPISTVIHWHVIWSTNSLTHGSGYKTFKTPDGSSNNWFVTLLSSGEGWHNNHHAFPSSANQGFVHWWEFDFTYLIIMLLEKLGLVRNVKRPTPRAIQSKRMGLNPSPSEEPSV
jgi:fatty-acid desaturase